jgi:hypothetical protein
MPAGGGTAWSISTVDGDEPAKAISCVIIAHRQVRVFWKGEYEGAKTPPDCFSDDALHGIGDPGIECQVCPNAQFSSGKGKSQACQLKRMVFFLRADQMLPGYITLPPTSQVEGKSYITKLMALGLMPWDVLTEISLVKAKSDAGIDYSRAVFKRVCNLTPDQKLRMRAVVEEIRPALTSTRLSARDVESVDDTDGRAMPSAAYMDDTESVEI